MAIRATLVYNPNAAGTASISSAELVALLEDAGFAVYCQPGASPAELGPILRRPADLVVVAGGDGTVREVALHLVKGDAKGDVTTPLAILPLGTANNIARTLGLETSPHELITGLSRPRLKRFDLGLAHGPWGDMCFLEAFGFGLFARGLFAHNPKKGKSPVRVLQAVIDTLATHEAQTWQVTLDGEDISGAYLMVEVMNTSLMGPRLRLAPVADPGDGYFEVVLIAEDQRVGVGAYLAGLLRDELSELPNVVVRRGKQLELSWDGASPLHFDEELRPEPVEGPDGQAVEVAEPGGLVEVALQAGALELWLPAQSGEAAREVA